MEAIEFETEDPAFAGEMRMTVTLSPAGQGTYVQVEFDGIPEGIDLDASEAGTRSTLKQLSDLVGRTPCQAAPPLPIPPVHWP